MATGSPQPEVGPQDVDDAAGPHADDEATHADQDTLILDNLAIIINQGAEWCRKTFEVPFTISFLHKTNNKILKYS